MVLIWKYIFNNRSDESLKRRIKSEKNLHDCNFEGKDFSTTDQNAPKIAPKKKKQFGNGLSWEIDFLTTDLMKV